jgi:hypothetical protein
MEAAARNPRRRLVFVQQLQFLQVQGLQRQPPSAALVSIFFSIGLLLVSNSGRKGY